MLNELAPYFTCTQNLEEKKNTAGPDASPRTTCLLRTARAFVYRTVPTQVRVLVNVTEA